MAFNNVLAMFAPISLSTIMGKIAVDHRVVTRDASGKIISDLPFESFDKADLPYRAAAAAVPEGCEVTLQHGVRIIFRATSEIS